MTRRTRLAAYLVAHAGSDIVLSRIAPGYPGAGAWTLPGGGVEWGEHPEAALRREVYEEAGFDVPNPSFLGIDSRVYPASGDHDELHAVRLIYEAPVSGHPRVTEIGGSVDDARWFSTPEIADARTVDLVGVGLDLLLRSRRPSG